MKLKKIKEGCKTDSSVCMIRKGGVKDKKEKYFIVFDYVEQRGGGDTPEDDEDGVVGPFSNLEITKKEIAKITRKYGHDGLSVFIIKGKRIEVELIDKIVYEFKIKL